MGLRGRKPNLSYRWPPAACPRSEPKLEREGAGSSPLLVEIVKKRREMGHAKVPSGYNLNLMSI